MAHSFRAGGLIALFRNIFLAKSWLNLICRRTMLMGHEHQSEVISRPERANLINHILTFFTFFLIHVSQADHVVDIEQILIPILLLQDNS